MLAAAWSSRWALCRVFSTSPRISGPSPARMKTSPRCFLSSCGTHIGGVAGAELLGLLDPGDPLVVPNSADHLVLAVPDDHQDCACTPAS